MYIANLNIMLSSIYFICMDRVGIESKFSLCQISAFLKRVNRNSRILIGFINDFMKMIVKVLKDY